MVFAVIFAFWRVMQIITLIPTMGILAWFVHGFISANELTPNYVLILFITSVLGVAWCLFTIFSYHRSSMNALFVALIDLGFVGTLIAAVYELRFIATANCTHISASDPWVVSAGLITVSGQGISINTDKPCAMLKTAFAFGIMNCVFFFCTAILAWMHGSRLSTTEGDRRYVRETTTRVHRRRSGSGSHRPASRSHHSRSRRSSHSNQRVYV
ncbi:hypothetical protein CMQ_3517 [Grosmannia clavigera kw1407]|uniref:MARVEL domain-containing protein n=1 Tax=Grosmannia clavigera (strain kw1407 / UAMH 11150) TaxID=655863 RepID=F0X9Y2_GROCL|nr:uncharacterized protein CMQ_3517 [Grosmannia clavigera kw1407]EFX05448.1 hypothetical protein CMQ_3517 [Grosmannia clavigera kw1407]